ncbi:MAG: radical SAM protein, partial [Spirochaetota bacterium]|nr:radical SAM protein [Spirochaetota bacterium]
MTNIDLYNKLPGVPESSPLFTIYQKVLSGVRITENDALVLFNSKNILEIAAMANIVRNRWNHDKAHYILNGHINYSNICAIKCSFCSFSKKNGDDNAYFMTVDEIKNKFLEFNQDEIREIHIVGGLNPN